LKSSDGEDIVIRHYRTARSIRCLHLNPQEKAGNNLPLGIKLS
jgi:hypothetical protein